MRILHFGTACPTSCAKTSGASSAQVGDFEKCPLVGLKRICDNILDLNRKDGVTLMRGKVLAGAAGRDSRLFLSDDEKDVEHIRR